VLQALPYPIQVIVVLLAYRQISATLDGQGTTRYTSEEISDSRLQIWESINALLAESKRNTSGEGGKPFWVLGRSGPSEVDATLFGFVTSAMVCDAGPDSRRVVKTFPVILEYAERIHNSYFPDFAIWE